MVAMRPMLDVTRFCVRGFGTGPVDYERPPGVGIIVRVHEKTSCFLVADALAIHGTL
jgi:hypothetical protein